MTEKEAIEIIKKEFKRIKYFKQECDACVDDELIDAIDIVNDILDERLDLNEYVEALDDAIIINRGVNNEI